MQRISCAFTGHRPKKLPWRCDETSEGYIWLKETLSSQIAKLIENGVTDFLSGMAMGIDQICAELVLTRREKNPALKLHCILPCIDQDVQWPVSAQERYRSVLEQADSIVYVNRGCPKNYMLQRDKFLVEWSACLLAVYNGERRGGTAATVRYAEKAGREIILINPVTLCTTCEGTLKE